jgi:glycosyltransferase involved in cell wall biosynthesis
LRVYLKYAIFGFVNISLNFIKVLQLIDSLEPGGAERVAVNLANGLSGKIEASFLCATRKEGLLKDGISNQVGYLFLRKKQAIDFKAIWVLNNFVKKNKIGIIHAHSTSFFMAILIKLLNRNLMVIWHDHYGNSEFLASRNSKVLEFCSKYFSHIFSVNKALEAWAKHHLKTKSISYLPNFAVADKSLAVTNLHGVSGKRIVCLANLRSQKDHFTLLEAFKNVLELHPAWTLHCVGKDFKDAYSSQVKAKIKELDLAKSVFVYGSKPDVFNILKQSEIGVLSSKSEGLPIALLEYGLANLAVVATRVGECNNVIHENYNGFLVDSSNSKTLSKYLTLYIQDRTLREEHANRFSQHIKAYFSVESQLNNILEIYKTSIK